MGALAYRHLVILQALLLLSACAGIPAASQRQAQADALALQAGWQRMPVETSYFTLQTYLPAFPTGTGTGTLTIYIEGDGLAWLDRSTPSTNPTPLNPLALQLALRDTTSSAYLARPCQFVAAAQWRNCRDKYWTSHRFAGEVIESSRQAVDHLKRQFGAEKLILVGYSGGGAVAALVAAGRQDVTRLITIAGNLEPDLWAKQAALSPLRGSLNPADAWQQLVHIPQTHFVGAKDRIVSEQLARAYAARFPADAQPKIVVLPEFDHHRPWLEYWPALKDRDSNVLR